MKHRLLTSVLLVSLATGVGLIAACEPSGKNLGRATSPSSDYQIVVIEGCEYIEVARNLDFNNAAYSLTHKGNCKNPIHQHNKSETKEGTVTFVK